MKSKMLRKILPTSLIIAIIASTIGPIASFAALINSSSGAPYVAGPQTISTNSPQTAVLGLNLGNATSRTVTAMTVTVAGPNGSFNPVTDLDGMNPVSIYSDSVGDGIFDFAVDTQIASNITSLNPNGVRLSNLTPLSTGTYTIDGVTNTTSPALHPGDMVFGIFNSSDSQIPTWGVVTTDLTGTTFQVNGRPLDGSPHVISKFGGGFGNAVGIMTGAAGANPWSVMGGSYTPANGDMILYQTGSAPAIWGVVTDASSTNQNSFKVNGSTLSPSTTYTISKLSSNFTTSTTTIDPGIADTFVGGMNFNVGDLVFSNSGFGGYQWSVVTTGDTIAPGGMTGNTLRLNDNYSAPRFGVGTRVTKITPSGTGRSTDGSPSFTAGDATFTYTIADNYLAAYGWRQVSVGGLGGMAGALSFGSGTPVYPTTYRIVPNTPIDLPTSAGGHGASGYNLFITTKTGMAATNGHQFLVALAGSRSIEISGGDTINPTTLYAGNTTQSALKTGIYTISSGGPGGGGGGGDNNDSEGTATLTWVAMPYSGTIDSFSDVDYYKFEVTSGNTYTISTTLSTLGSGTVQAYGVGAYSSGAPASMPTSIIAHANANGYFYVVVRGSASTGNYSLNITAGGGGGPGMNVPTGLSSMSTTSSSIDLIWNSVAPGAEYQVARSSSFGGEYTPVGSSTFTTSFTDTGLSPATTYYYKVRSLISATYSDYSSPYSAMTSAGGGGGAPGGDGNDTYMTATMAWSGMGNSATIGQAGDVDYYSFSAPSTQSYSFAVTNTTIEGHYITLYDSSGISVLQSGILNADVTFNGTMGTTYYLKVANSNPAGTGAYTYFLSALGGGGGGGNVPVGLTSMANTSSTINLSWTAVGGATDYEITRSTSGEFGMYTHLATVMTNSYQDSNLSSMTTYWYKVRSLVSATYSDYSSAYGGATSAGGGGGGAPGGEPNDTTMTATPITINAMSPTSASIDTMGDVDYYSFTGMGGTSYTIHATGTISSGTIHASGSGAYDSGAPVSIPGEITFTANGMGTYYVDVRGVASTGNYNVWITTGGGGGGGGNVPVGLTSMANTSSTINLSWTAVGGATDYEITRSDSEFGMYSHLTTVMTNSYQDSSLSSSTSYWYKVRAYVSATYSDYSSPYRGTTSGGGGGGGGDMDGNTTMTATAIDIGSTKNANIDYSDDVDYFSFFGTNGTTYTVSPSLIMLTGGSYRVTNGGMYDSSSSSMISPLTFTAPATGTYYIAVAATGPLVGTYSLIVTIAGGGGGGGSAPTLTFSGPSNNATNVPISSLINFAFSTALDFSTLISSNITLTKSVGGIPTNVDYTIIPSYSGFQMAISSKPTFAASSYFSKFSSGPTAVSLNGTLQGGYTPTTGDIVFVQKGNFAPYVGIYTGSGVNGFNLMNGDRITRIGPATVTGQRNALNETLTVNTGDVMLAYTADNHDQANGFTWHMVTDGGDMGQHVVSPELNNAVTLDDYTGTVGQNYISPYFSTISPAASTTDNGTTAGNTLDVNQGDMIFAKLASESIYKWHLVTQTGVLSSAGSESTAGVDGLNSNDSRVRIGSVMSNFGAVGAAGPIAADTTSFSDGDVVFAKTTAGAANNNAYNFHMVTKPASSSINNDTLRFDNATSDLEPNTTYNITIDTDVKAAGGGGAYLASPISVTFTTSSTSTTNTAAPVIQATTPNTGNMNFPIGSKIKVDFSVPMAIEGSGSVLNTNNVGIFENNFGQPGAAVASTNTYDASKNEVIVSPNSSLQTNHNYILQVNSSTKSSTGTSIPGTRIIGFKTSTTSATTTPTITGTYPGRDAISVPTQLGAIAINFSEDMDQSTFSTYDGNNDGSTASVTLKQGDAYVAGSFNYNSFEHTLYFSPEGVLSPMSTYTITVKNSVQSINATAIASQFTSSFTTAGADLASTNPYITNSICDQFSCAVTFSEPMKHSGNQESVNNSANWDLESPEHSTISLANKTITYDGSTMTAKVTGLSLTTGTGYKITMNTSVKSTAEVEIQSGNRTVYGTVISANVTGGQVGLTATATNIDPSINGMTPINVFVERLSAGANSTYWLDFPAKSSIPSGGQIVITFPVGFDIKNAIAGDTQSDSDINGPASGTVTMSSVDTDSKARTITINTAGGDIATNDHVRFSLRNIVNSSIVSQAGYSLQIQLKDTAVNSRLIKENLTSNKFFLAAAGTHSLTVRVINDSNRNGIRDDGEASINGAKVFIWSPSSGSQNETVSDGQAVFTNLPTDNYNVSVDASAATDAGLNLSKNWNNIFVNNDAELTFAATAADNTISGTITGTPGTQIDIFASGMSGDFSFKKTTGTIGGGGTYSYTLPASANSTYNVNVGPAISATNTVAGGVAVMPTFTFMPPAPKQVHVANSNITSVDFNLSSLDKTISGTVTDNNGNSIPGATLFARPTSSISGETAMGLSAQSDSSGNYSINVKAGEYLVSAYKPGMPFIEDQHITVSTLGPNSPTTLNFKFSARTGTTITGRVLDKNGNAVAYAGVWGYKVNSTLDTTATGGSGGNNTSSQTDSNGNYTLYVSTGTWNINAFAPGLGKMPAQTIQVGSDSITGQDFNASTMNIGTVSGTASQGGSGQAGVAVMISNSNFSNNTVTANDGTFSMNVPEGSNYTMTCFFPGNGNSSPISNITVTKDQTLTQNCTINNAMTIQVRLTDGTNPISNAFVDVRDASGNGNGTNVNQTSGIYGVYTIKVPAGRTYNVMANSPTFGKIGQQLNVTESGTITFTAPSNLYTVSGTVLFGYTTIPNAWVSLFGTVEGSNNNIHVGAQTNASGEFSISVPNGNYKLRADKAGYISATVLSNINIHGGNLSGNTIGLFPSNYSINGTVTLDSNPVANAKIDAFNTDGGFTFTESDTDGNYSLPVRNGTWTVRAHSIGYESAASTITIDNASSNSNTLTLSAISGFTVRPEVVNTFAPSVGGFIENQNIGDKFRMTVPANALGSSENPASIHTQIDTTLPRSPTGLVFNTNAISITAVDASGELIKSLDGQVTIVIPYDPTLLPEGTDENTLVIAYWNPSTQSYETLATTVDTENHTLTAVTDHFSSFAPMLPTGNSAPSTPTGLASSDVTASSVTLTWDSVAAATTYNIYRSTDGGDTFPLLKSVSAPDVTTSDSGLTAGTEYRYKVSSENTDGESSASSNITITTIPATPTGFTSSNHTSSSTDLSWNSSTGATGYKIYKDDVLLGTVDAPATSTTDTGLSANTYTYKISAYNGTGESSQSTGISVTISSNQENNNNGGGGSSGGSLPSAGKINKVKTTKPNTTSATKNEDKNTLPDVEDSWAKTEIKAMIAKGIVKGNAEGKFKPEDNLNRADSAILICRVMKIDETLATENAPFKDVEKEAYFGSCVAQLKAAKITTGNADGTFKPANSINRAEFIALAMRAYGTFLKDQEQKDFNTALNSKYPRYSFIDVSTKKSWYANVAYVAQTKGFVMGRECGKTRCFDGAKTITRAEATTILYRMFIDLLNQ